ncbi:hypothetical protein [Cryobacterium arcticum]|uniref:Dinucleotide-utilizing enzyme n=1 Tax=Cryobacterium arcticum TaxID=670052 RepID=A0A1B1BI84_9MICO|nr:hypothetical protein [Cryobacterium arcticum]ANP72176.1 hypothetical protein PA27867_1210 [Cryobacterium arcticum]
MSQNSSRPLSKFNLVLAVLWLVDLVVTVAGYLILTSSNATQAEFYTSQSSDYVAYFTAQSGSNLGANLLAAGVIGFIITLAALVVSRAIAKSATAVATVDAAHDEPDFNFDDDSDFDAEETTPMRARTAETGTVSATDAPAERPVTPSVVADETAAAPANDSPTATTAKTTDASGDEPTVKF